MTGITRHDNEITMGNENILLVDDEDAVLDVNQEVLETLGYHVIPARSGAAVALGAKAREKKDSARRSFSVPCLSWRQAFAARFLLAEAIHRTSLRTFPCFARAGFVGSLQVFSEAFHSAASSFGSASRVGSCVADFASSSKTQFNE